MAGMTYTGNVRSPADWAGDFGGREHIVPVPARIDPAQFTNKLGIPVAITTNAAQNATAVTVSALTLATTAAAALITVGNIVIPAGATLDFGGSKFARLTANAILGDTVLTVAALPTAVVNGDKATFSFVPGTVYVPSGTLIGRTYAERDASTPYGPAALTDDEVWLLYNDVVDARSNPDAELYRHQSLVKENYLPDYATFNTSADEVQNVAVGGTVTAGSFKLGITQPSGALVLTDTIAWNSTNSTIITNINTALNDVLGASAVVATDNSGTAANPNFNLTFSGTNYTGVPQQLVLVDLGAFTGASTATVSRTTSGGKAFLNLVRKFYRCIKGTD